MLKVTSPLIIPIQEFDTFKDYFQSLTKSCRNSLTLPKQKRLMDGLIYRQLGWEEDLIKYFMNLWENQSIHFGTPRWPDNWFEFLKELHSRGNFEMFGMLKGNEVISVHFLFKFNDYIYCNSPLYDKEEYDKISLGRLMWYNLIKFCIKTKFCNFLDLEGNNNGETYREVIENKVTPGTPGDFGYKWFFIPEKIKELDEEYTDYYDYKTAVVDNGKWKGLTNEVETIKKTINRKYKRVSTSIYESIFGVSKNDVVVDIGAGNGKFSRSIFDKASKVYIIEPDSNIDHIADNVEIINKGIGSYNEDEIINSKLELVVRPSIKFMDFVESNNIDKIDFMKVNCNGGEWYLFDARDTTNIKWISKNVNKLVVVFNNISLDKRKFEYEENGIPYYTMINQPGNWRVFKDIHIDYFKEHGFDVVVTNLEGNEITDLENINDCIVHMKQDEGWIKVFDEKIRNEVDLYFKHFPIEDGDVVVDLGASTGLFSIEAAKTASVVYAVEPFPEMLDVLKPRVKDIDNIIVDEVAIGTGRNEEFEIIGAVQSERTLVNKSQTFMEFVKKHNIEKIDFLKIDIENAEYYIFSDLDDKDDYIDRLTWIKNNVKKLVVELDSNTDSVDWSQKEAIHFIDYVIPFLDGKTNLVYCTGIDINEWDVNTVGKSYGIVEIPGGWRNSKEFTDMMNQFLVHIDLRNITKYKHHFYIRNYGRINELSVLLNQLSDIGIEKEQITLITTWKTRTKGYEVYKLYNSGYQQGDADTLQKSFNLSNPNQINHYMNAGMVMYDKNRFKQYLTMTENSNDIIHIARGNDLLDNDYNSNLGSTNQFELATGMIITATGPGIDILKNCYHENYIGWREVELKGDPIYISYLQHYISHNGRGDPYLRAFPTDNPFVNDQDLKDDTAALYIEYYFYQKVWEQTKFRLVNFTDNYRGIYFKDNSEKTTGDWLLNRDAGLIRLSKYMDEDVQERMLDIIREESLYEQLGFHKESKMEKNSYRNLLVVSHMDDETIFFGNWLFLNGKDTKVIVTCKPSTNIEKEESFNKVMEYCNVPAYEKWEWEESLNGYGNLDRLKNKIKDELEKNEYKDVVTHNSYGEYGHIQHQQLNEIMSECLYESIIDGFYVYDLNPLSLDARGYDTNQKEDMLNMYPEQEKIHTIDIMRRCESTWYDHCKPAKWGSKFLGGGNLIDYEGLKLIENLYDQKINIGIIREIPTLNNNYSETFGGKVVKASEEEEKFDDVYFSPTNDFLKTIKSYFRNHNIDWVDTLNEYDEFIGLTNENKQMYIVATVESAMVLHKLGLPYMFFSNFSDDIPLEIKSSASRIIYPSHSYGVSQFNETVIDFTRHHHVVKYDLHGQLHKAVIMKKRHNTISVENMFSFFQIEDDSDPDTLGRLHMNLNNLDYEGFYFIEGMEIGSGDIVCNWKVNLSTTNSIWISAGITENAGNEGLVLRFWKDPSKCEPGDGLHPEPHNHEYLPDWKTKKVKYPDFTLIVPKRYKFSEWQ